MADNSVVLVLWGILEMRTRDETDAMSLDLPKQIIAQLSSAGAPARVVMLLDKLLANKPPKAPWRL